MTTSKAIDIDYLASLARLELSPEEKERYTQQIQNTLQYLDQVNAVDVSGIKGDTYSFTRYNVWAEDIAEAPLDLEATLLNAPKRNGESFEVPQVIDEA